MTNPNIRDLTKENPFSRLTVLRRGKRPEHIKGRGAWWWCSCSCGNPKEVLIAGYCLTQGITKSCGCLRKERYERGMRGLKRPRNEHQWYEESYLPDKKYPKEGLITGEVKNHYDEDLIRRFLQGENKKFGKWQVVEWLGRVSRTTHGRRHTQALWRIQCSCGFERTIVHDNMNSI